MRPLPHQVLRQLLRRVPPTHPCGVKGTTPSGSSVCWLRLSSVPSGHQELHHKGRYWHEECFRCAKCYKNLAKEPFSTKDERIMCGKCCSKEAAPRCHGCYKSILAGKLIL